MSGRRWPSPTRVAKTDEQLDHAIRQLVSKAIAAPDGVVDIFAAAGLSKPNISILSDEFLAEVKTLPHRNVAVELLRKLPGNGHRRIEGGGGVMCGVGGGRVNGQSCIGTTGQVCKPNTQATAGGRW